MDAKDLQARFTYHPPKEPEIMKFVEIRKQAGVLALLIDSLCPDSREKSLSITKLEEAVFWANAGIARHGNGNSLPTV